MIESHGEITIDSEVFRHKVKGWLGNDEQLYQQALNQNTTAIYNYYTHDETLFNPLRAKRPVPKELVNDFK